MKQDRVRYDAQSTDLTMLPEEHRGGLLHAATEEEALANAREIQRAQRFQDTGKNYTGPTEVVDCSASGAAFDSAIRSTAEDIEGTGEAIPQVAERLPALAKRAGMLAARAAQQLPGALDRLGAAASRLGQAAEEAGRRAISPETLERMKVALRLLTIALLFASGMEYAICIIAFVDFDGRLAISTALKGTSVATAFLLFAHAVVGWFHALPQASSLRRFGGVGAVIVFLAMLVCMALLRVAADTEMDSDEAVSWLLNAATVARLFLILAAGFAFSVLCAELARRYRPLAAEVAKVQNHNDDYAHELSGLRFTVSDDEAEVTKLQQSCDLPDRLQQAFEEGVTQELQRLRRLASREASTLNLVRVVYRSLKSTTLVEKAFIKEANFEVVRAGGKKAKGQGTGPAAIALCIAASSISASACSAPETQPAVIRAVVVDPTGEHSARVGTQDSLLRDVYAWMKAAENAPGSEYLPIITAADFATTSVESVVEVPASWGRKPRKARAKWRLEAVNRLATIRIEADTPETKTVNRSNLLAAILMAAHRVGQRADGTTAQLVVMSDARFVGFGFNLDGPQEKAHRRRRRGRQIPEAEAVVAAVEASGATWDTSAFRSVRLCGVHAAGLTAGELAKLEGLWTSLIEIGGGPTPIIQPSCANLAPPLPRRYGELVGARANRSSP